MAYEWETPDAAAGLFANVNGEVVPTEEATVSAFDRAVLYGDAVFDSFPVHDGKVVLLDRHVDRLFRSAAAAKIDLDLPKAEIRGRVVETLEAGGVTDGSVRILVTRGVGRTGIINTDHLSEPTVLVLTTTRPEESFKHDGISTATARIVSTRTTPPDTLDPGIKSTNYLNNALAERELVGTDATHAIMLDHHGHVAEAYAANVFVRDDRGTFLTPPFGSILGGITREVVMEVGRDRGFDVRERTLTPSDLFAADDVFLTSSGLGIASIGELDGRPIGDGEPSDALRELADAFFEYIHTEEYVEVGG